ncbi:MAG TPA: hypothetical protein VIM73_15245, partial [Polyangiaceae bacterium]
VRQLDPLLALPARIEPLGPMAAGTSANNASWEAYMRALNPVRELPPEQCPSKGPELGDEQRPLMARRSGRDLRPRECAGV